LTLSDALKKLAKAVSGWRPASGHTKPNEAAGVTIIDDGEHSYSFCFRSAKEKRRAERIFEKEPGTIAWLRRELRPSDVFYDIGANIGVYTVFASARIGDGGIIYAFEPHIPNAASLIENVFANRAAEKIILISTPLAEEERFDFFNYQSVLPASSTSQFGRNSYEGKTFESVFREVKFGTTIDHLIEKDFIRPPDLIKIDVDGLDFEVLAGMRQLLSGTRRPRSFQIEMGSESRPKIMRICDELGYQLKEKHWTMAGQKHIESGKQPEDYPHYGIFGIE
jgi:FkbM family methyltransferase